MAVRFVSRMRLWNPWCGIRMIGTRVTLEICTASVQDALIAAAAGADRIELNTALSLGGLTPSPGMVRLVTQQLSIPVIAMVRPRESGFCYSDAEFQTLVEDVRWLVDAGVAGIAFGVLDRQGQVDRSRCDQILGLLRDQQQGVFHRAFDLVPDKQTALESLVQCGIPRVMTSGGASTAWQGRQVIGDLVRQAGTRIEILAAGGIRVDHVTAFLQETGVRQLHAGLGTPQRDASYPEAGGVNFYGPLPADPAQFRQSCPQKIREMKQAISQLGGLE